jgi:cupin-like protein
METTSERTAAGSGVKLPLELNAEVFRAQFPQRPFLLNHNLANHPLFAVSRLLELSRALPASCVEYNEGRISANMGGRLSPQTGLSVQETIRRIQEDHSWMVLKYVENDAEYRDLLDRCLNQVRELSEAIVPGMCNREAFIFLTSPDSVTPFHVDPEHNFLLQIRGRKQVTMFDPRDTAIVTEADIERGLFTKNRNLTYKPEFQARGEVFELAPGAGLHFPVAAPHWVKNGGEVSISFSVTFRSRDSERNLAVRQFNSVLRQRGFQPKPVGVSPVSDSVKYFSHRAMRRTRQVFQPGNHA